MASESRPVGALSRIVSSVLLALIAGYRLVISPWLPPRCRFAPSCSAYAAEAIGRHGPSKGVRLAIARVARCHPWHAGGHDPVPPVPPAVPVAQASRQSRSSVAPECSAHDSADRIIDRSAVHGTDLDANRRRA